MRKKLYTIIFESGTPAGKAFDVGLILVILLSVLVVILDSVPEIHAAYGEQLYLAEWVFTLLFTLEYCLRLYCIDRPLLYAKSFYGIVDLLAILPTYFSVIFPGSQFFLVIRGLRLLRIFRVLKFVQYVKDANELISDIYAARRKIFLFFFFVITLVVILGSMMHLIEGDVNPGFDNIPKSIYWAIVTITTVGYGDITPITILGRFLAAMIMILGYSIIAVPSGIITSEMLKRKHKRQFVCSQCSSEDHEDNASFCKSCGSPLKE